MAGLAARVAGELREALALRGGASLAVPGGTTPGPFLSRLSLADLDWSRVRVMLSDERFVPETSDRSNTALLRRTLLTNRAAAARLLPFFEPAESPDAILARLEGPIRAALPLDVCVLGMGEDMHTASLFPGADRLAEGLDPQGGAVLLPMRAPGAAEPRLTLTAPVLLSARHLHLLITGSAKRQALDRARSAQSVHEAPVRVLFDRTGPFHIHYAG
jgi:6-phosphogluconolactonase